MAVLLLAADPDLIAMVPTPALARGQGQGQGPGQGLGQGPCQGSGSGAVSAQTRLFLKPHVCTDAESVLGVEAVLVLRGDAFGAAAVVQ